MITLVSEHLVFERLRGAGLVRCVLSPALFILSILSPSLLNAQSLVSDDLGTHFLIPIPDTVENKNGGTRLTLEPHLELVLSAPREAEVSLTGPTGIVMNVQIAAGASEIVSIYDLYPSGVPIPLDPPGLRDPRIVEVRSDEPIWTLLRIVTPFGSETFRPRPVGSWGTAYRLASLRNWFVQSIGVDPNTSEEGFEILDVYPYAIVVAAEDGTNVTLDPGTPTPGPTEFTLDAGEAYSVPITRRANALDTAARDLSGLLVTADRPIGIITGNTRSPAAAPVEDLVVLPGNSLHNLLAEWLPPVSALGRTFVYRPVNTLVEGAPEVIRIIGTSAGTSTVQTSTGESFSIGPGEWRELRVPGIVDGDTVSAFSIESDQPLLAILVTGARGIYVPNDDAGQGYGYLDTWSPAMTLLEPVEEWGNTAMAIGFPFPASVDQSAVIVAEAGTIMAMDGRPVPLASVPGTPFLSGRVEIGPGDHHLRSIGGNFSAIGYGIRSGVEAFLVPGIGDGDDGKERLPAHVTEYVEHMSIAWATPLPSGVIENPPSDSITVTRDEFCDSTVITIRRESDTPEREGPLDVAFLDGVNARATFDTLASEGAVTGFRIELHPVDREREGTGRIVVRGVGMDRTIEYRHDPASLEIPDVIDLGTGITPGSTLRITEVIRNLRSFPITILEMRVLTIPGPFAVEVDIDLPETVGPNGSLDFDVIFSGNIRSHSYRDTLVIRTDCGEYRIPLRAETSDEEVQEPLPTITGYDWGTRPVGSTNDTLSLISNSGAQSYTIDEVRILGSGAKPFALVAPFHSANVVADGDTIRVGIRFAPTVPGEWSDTIVLVTDGGHSVRALLHGVSVDTVRRFNFEVDPVNIDTVCVGDTLLVRLSLRNRGSIPVPIEQVSAIRSTNAALVDISYPDGPVIPIDGEVTIVVRIIPSAPGPLELLLGVVPEGDPEGQVVRITGVGKVCAPPELIVTDHDFGELWITTSKSGSVWVKNVGRGEVTVFSAEIVDDPDESFTYLDPPTPIVLAEGDSIEVFIRFTPESTGEHRAEILFSTSIGERISRLVGVGKKLVVPAFIRRDYTAAPGTDVFIDIEIEEPTDTVFPGKLAYRVRFADELLDALGVVDSSGVEVPTVGFGEISGVRSFDPTDSLRGGTLVTLRFLVRLSLLKETELPFELESDLAWLEFDERPGLFAREEICALENRLFEFTRFGVEIGFPQPNPSSLEAEFVFEVPFNAHTTVAVYDLLGNEVLRPLDAFISAGRYTLVIPSGQLAPGTYILRFRSGTFEATRRINVVR